MEWKRPRQPRRNNTHFGIKGKVFPLFKKKDKSALKIYINEMTRQIKMG